MKASSSFRLHPSSFDLPFASIATRLALLAADLAAAPWLGHVAVSFPASSGDSQVLFMLRAREPAGACAAQGIAKRNLRPDAAAARYNLYRHIDCSSTCGRVFSYGGMPNG